MVWNCTWLGIRVGLFTPDRAFEEVVKTKITQLKQPCLKLVELCVGEIMQIFMPLFLKVGIRVCKWMTLLLTICLFFVPHSAGGSSKNLWVHMVKEGLSREQVYFFYFCLILGVQLQPQFRRPCPHDQFFLRPGKSFLTTGFWGKEAWRPTPKWNTRFFFAFSKRTQLWLP